MLADGTKARVIDALDWVEVSPVLRGASPNTQTIASKSASDAPDTEEVVDVASDTEIEAIRLGIEIEITKLNITEGKK